MLYIFFRCLVNKLIPNGPKLQRYGMETTEFSFQSVKNPVSNRTTVACRMQSIHAATNLPHFKIDNTKSPVLCHVPRFFESSPLTTSIDHSLTRCLFHFVSFSHTSHRTPKWSSEKKRINSIYSRINCELVVLWFVLFSVVVNLHHSIHNNHKHKNYGEINKSRRKRDLFSIVMTPHKIH